MTRVTRTFTAAATVLALGTASLSGCASMNQTEKGAVIGAAGGGVIGGVIGKQLGNTAAGALIGAAVGGTAGGIIGRQMDNRAEELREEIPGATVQRVGEGIAVTFASGLLYPYNSAELLPAAQTNLNNLAQSLSEWPDTEIVIVGHTDARGTDAYNQALSERRAEAAKRYLVNQGVRADRIVTYGRGESEPIAENETEAGMQQNRRVEIAIFASEEHRERLLRSNPGE